MNSHTRETLFWKHGFNFAGIWTGFRKTEGLKAAAVRRKGQADNPEGNISDWIKLIRRSCATEEKEFFKPLKEGNSIPDTKAPIDGEWKIWYPESNWICGRADRQSGMIEIRKVYSPSEPKATEIRFLNSLTGTSSTCMAFAASADRAP